MFRLFRVALSFICLVSVFFVLDACREGVEDDELSEYQENALILFAADSLAIDTSGNPLSNCVDLIYPVTMLMPSGDVITVDSREALKTVLDQFILDGSSAMDYPILEFPVDVLLNGVDVLMVTDEVMLNDVLSQCTGVAYDDDDDDDDDDD